MWFYSFNINHVNHSQRTCTPSRKCVRSLIFKTNSPTQTFTALLRVVRIQVRSKCHVLIIISSSYILSENNLYVKVSHRLSPKLYARPASDI